MKKLIFRKFTNDVIGFFLLSTISVSIIIWVIQAVNFLDFVSEDGHSFKVYFMYTFLSFPKIFSRILPFMFFLSLFYIYLKYEENNELLIFWLHGVRKFEFIKKILVLSLLFLLFQILLTSFIVPFTQDKARSFLRTSTIDFFPSLIKEKKFIDKVSNLTIFIEKKYSDGRLENIFLKDEISDQESQVIFAKSGMIKKNENSHFLILFNGNIINKNENNKNVISFEKTRFNLSKYSTKSTTFPKISELSTSVLLSCLYNLYINTPENFNYKYLMCEKKNEGPIFSEIFRRVVLPFYIPVIGLITSFILLTSKDKLNFKSYKLRIFIFCSLTIIISEISIRYSGYSMRNNLIFFMIPLSLFFLTMTILLKKLRTS